MWVFATGFILTGVISIPAHLLSIMLYDVCTAVENIESASDYPGFFPGSSSEYLNSCIFGDGQIITSLNSYDNTINTIGSSVSTFDSSIDDISTSTTEIDELITTVEAMVISPSTVELVTGVQPSAFLASMNEISDNSLGNDYTCEGLNDRIVDNDCSSLSGYSIGTDPPT